MVTEGCANGDSTKRSRHTSSCVASALLHSAQRVMPSPAGPPSRNISKREATRSTSACAARQSADSRSRGGTERSSASCRARNSPRAAETPAPSAATSPWRPCSITRRRRSRSAHARAKAREPSRDPSSTTRNSMSWPGSARTEPSAASKVGEASRTGMSPDSITLRSRPKTPRALPQEGSPRQTSVDSSKLLLAESLHFGGLGDAELEHRLGRNLDLFAGLRIAALACLALHDPELANTGKREALARFLVGQHRDLLEHARAGLLGEAELVRQVRCDLRLRHRARVRLASHSRSPFP